MRILSLIYPKCAQKYIFILIITTFGRCIFLYDSQNFNILKSLLEHLPSLDTMMDSFTPSNPSHIRRPDSGKRQHQRRCQGDFHRHRFRIHPNPDPEQMSNTTPSALITEYIILEAKSLLQSGQYTVHRVCELLGFENDSFFNRYFKKSTGLTPGRWIRQFSYD